MMYKKYVVGQSESITKSFSEEDVLCFANLSGDSNPLHLDDDVAKSGIFGRKVVHGCLATGLISAVIGTKLPGNGTIYLEQSARFIKPIYIGETVTALCKIEEVIDPDKQIIRLKTIVKKQDDEIAIDGFAIVKAQS